MITARTLRWIYTIIAAVALVVFASLGADPCGISGCAP